MIMNHSIIGFFFWNTRPTVAFAVVGASRNYESHPVAAAMFAYQLRCSVPVEGARVIRVHAEEQAV